MNTIEVKSNKLISNFDLEIKDNNIYLKNIDVSLVYENSSNPYNFVILGNVKIFEYYKNCNLHNYYQVKEKSNLTLNRFCFDCSLETSIDLEEKSNLIYKYSCLNFSNNTYTINVNHEKDSKSKIINNGLNMTDKKLDFIINCKISKDSFGVDTNQDSKIILMNDGDSSIKPNLLIDNDDIIANHACYIGSFKKDELFYLKSRGLSESMSKKLLSKAFLIGNMEIDFSCVNKILQDLNNNWMVEGVKL